MREKILEQLTAVRIELDAILAIIKTDPKTRGTANLALHFIQNAFMWAGRAKGLMGSPNPYPLSADPSSAVIEAPVDTFVGEIVIDEAETEVAFVKRMRNRIGEVEKTVVGALMIMLPEHKLFHETIGHVYAGVVNAKMYFGLRLGEIRVAQEIEEVAAKKESELPPTPDPNATALPPATTDTKPEMTASPGGNESGMPEVTPTPTPSETPAPQPQDQVPGPQPEQTPSQASAEVDATVPPPQPATEETPSEVPPTGPELEAEVKTKSKGKSK